MIKLILVSALFWFSFSCKVAHPVDQESDVESAPSGILGKNPLQVRALVNPLRLKLIETNSAICNIWGTDKWKDSFGTALTPKQKEDFERLTLTLGKDFLEEKHSNPISTIILVSAASEGIKYMAGKVDPFINTGVKFTGAVVATASNIHNIIDQGAQASNAILNFFEGVRKIKGAEFAFNAVKKFVPGVVQATEVVRNTAKVVSGIDAVSQTTKDVMIKASKTLGFLRLSLKIGAGFLGSYSDNILVCNVTSGLIDQLEYLEVKSYFDEQPPNNQERSRLKRRYCDLLQKRYPNKKSICNEID